MSSTSHYYDNLQGIITELTFAGVPWKPEPHDQQKHERLLNQTNIYHDKIHGLFLGDSITEGWLGNGKQIWDKYYVPRNIFNYGIGGDRTENVIWRIENGEFANVNPKVIVLMIGTNNIAANTPEDISKGIKVILEKLLELMPKTNILLLNVFPRGGEENDQKVHEINEFIEKFHNGKNIFYFSMMKNFETELGHVIDDLYISDKLHLQAKGYETWYKVMEPKFSQLLNQLN